VKVSLAQISPEEGYEVDELVEQDEFEEMVGAYEGHHAASQLQVDLKLTHVTRGILAYGRVTGKVTGPCSRCLEPLPDEIDVDVAVTYVAAPEVESLDEEVELDLEDLDTLFYEGDVIDLEPMIRESVLLEIEPYPQCQRIDPEVCDEYERRLEELAAEGADFSARSSNGESDDDIDPRWSALKALKQDESN